MSSFWYALGSPFRFLLGLPMRFAHGAHRLWGFSLPTAVAFGVFCVLTLLAISFYVLGYIWQQGRAATWGPLERPLELVLILALLIAIPLAVYQALKLWLVGDHVPFPDIDRAWNDGIKALHRQGVRLDEVPVFLVAGAADPQVCDSMMQASGMTLAVAGVPEGRQPLRWYSDGNSVFLFCVDLGHLGHLNRVASEQLTPSGGDARVTAVPTSQGDATSFGIRGTLVSGQPETAPTPTAPASAAIRGTMVPGAGAAPQGEAGAGPRSYSMSRTDIDQQLERLKYVGYLLRRERDPFCPVNGILALLPYGVLQNVIAASELPAAVKDDLESVRQQTQLNCPVVAMVINMEKEPGFTELIRRVGLGKAKSNRFGKGFEVWNAASLENMDALSAHACGAFEDWVYNLFREENGLNKPGNDKLFTLLCRVRSEMLVRLRNVLVHAFGNDRGDENAVLFGGCYFAATGASDEGQAFVRNVFEKVTSLEEELDWTDEVLAEDRRHSAWSRACIVAVGGLLAGMVLMFLYRYAWPET